MASRRGGGGRAYQRGRLNREAGFNRAFTLFLYRTLT